MLLHTEVYLLNPPEKLLQLNRSFLCADKQQFPESPRPPPSKFTWGWGTSAHVCDRGQNKTASTTRED